MVYFFFFRTKPKVPTRLNLKQVATDSPNESANDEIGARPERSVGGTEVIAHFPVRGDVAAICEVTAYERPELAVAPPKKFEVFFIYNAHEWEAHEVLSLPQGASFQQVTERYQILIKTSDASSFEFYEAAFKAILSKKEKL